MELLINLVDVEIPFQHISFWHAHYKYPAWVYTRFGGVNQLSTLLVYKFTISGNNLIMIPVFLQYKWELNEFHSVHNPFLASAEPSYPALHRSTQFVGVFDLLQEMDALWYWPQSSCTMASFHHYIFHHCSYLVYIFPPTCNNIDVWQ